MTDLNYCFLIKRIWERATKHANAKLNSLGLTVSQAIALEYISERKQPVTQKTLEEHMEIQHSAVVGIVSRLEEKGMVRSAASDTDRRQKLLYPTELAKQIRRAIRKDQETVERTLTMGFSKKETAQLEKMLVRIYENLADE